MSKDTSTDKRIFLCTYPNYFYYGLYPNSKQKNMEYLFYHKRKRSYQLRNLQKIKGYKSIVENAKQYLNSKNIYVATNGILLLSL